MNTSFKDDYQARFKEKFDASEILKVIERFYKYSFKINDRTINNSNRTKQLFYILGS